MLRTDVHPTSCKIVSRLIFGMKDDLYGAAGIAPLLQLTCRCTGSARQKPHVLLLSHIYGQILGVGLTMTTELIGFFIGEERDEEDAEEELPWASREVLAGAGFSEKSDVYSFGIVLWEIMQKDSSLPYAGLLPSQVCFAPFVKVLLTISCQYTLP